MQSVYSFASDRMRKLERFQKKISLEFNNLELLDRAFVHSSVINRENNERLEFVGDAVLGLVVATEVYSRLQGEDEGVLAKIRSFVVCEETLAEIGLHFGFDDCLCLGKGEEKTGGRKKKAIIADTVEAVIGAYYLDSGFEKARDLVILLTSLFIYRAIDEKAWYDYKSLLQAMLQKTHRSVPSYVLVATEGPEHDHTFYVQVTAAGNVYGPLQGKSKKEAEQKVAKLAYHALCT